MHIFHAFMDSLIKATIIVSKVLALCATAAITFLGVIISAAFK